MPADLARRAAGSDTLFSVLDIVEVASSLKRDIDSVARAYFAIAGELDFPWLRTAIGMLAGDDHWHSLAKAALRDDLASMLRALAQDVLSAEDGDLAAWKTRNAVPYERFRQVLADLRSAESPDLAMLSVAMRELRNLAR